MMDRCCYYHNQPGPTFYFIKQKLSSCVDLECLFVWRLPQVAIVFERNNSFSSFSKRIKCICAGRNSLRAMQIIK